MPARFALFAAALTLAACGGEAPEAVASMTDAASPAAEVTPAPLPPLEAPPAFDGPALEITMTPVDNQMEFEQTEIRARPGQTIRLTFDNTDTEPTMYHNVVFLRDDVDVDVFGQAAMMADQTMFIPLQYEDWMLAHTPMAAPGQTVSVEFTAPGPGRYTYLCSYPGHYMVMQGTLIVEAAA